MKIKIDNRFRIDADERNYTLVETYMGKDKDDNPKEQTTVHGYFTTLSTAIERIIRIRDAENEETVELEEYIQLLNGFVQELKNSVQGIASELEEKV